MIEQAAAWGPKLLALLIQAFRALRSLLPKRRPTLIFAEKSRSSWYVIEKGPNGKPLLRFQAVFAVTSDSQQEGLAIVQIRVRRGAFAFWRQLEDCWFCDIGGERVNPISPGVVIRPRTTATMEVRHDFVTLPRPRTKWLFFRIVVTVVTDRFNRHHNRCVRSRRFDPVR